jgi:hypothetical protein
MTTPDFPWHDSRLVAPATIHHLSVGGRSILFCEARQVVYGLNSTADRIWQSLAQGGAPVEATRQLADLGLTADEARAFVQNATSSWLNGGQLAPQEALASLSQRARTTRHYLIDELSVRIDFFGDIRVDDVDAVFGQFKIDPRPATLRISLVSCRDRIFLFEEDRPLGAHSELELIPRLKAVLTEHYTGCKRDGFLTHAAFLVRGNKGILLSGAPGAGKTTLCVALARSGFDYQGDDIVRLAHDGRATGTPFAACVKSSAWPLVEPYAPEITRLPVYRRGDGKDVRYLQLPVGDRRPRSVNIVLLLSRQENAEPAFQPIEPLEAFSVLLESAFSAKGAIAAPMLKTFAQAIESAASYRFVYSRLRDAIRAIKELSGD